METLQGVEELGFCAGFRHNAALVKKNLSSLGNDIFGDLVDASQILLF